MDEQQHEGYLALFLGGFVGQDERVADLHQVHLVLLLGAVVLNEHQRQL